MPASTVCTRPRSAPLAFAFLFVSIGAVSGCTKPTTGAGAEPGPAAITPDSLPESPAMQETQRAPEHSAPAPTPPLHSSEAVQEVEPSSNEPFGVIEWAGPSGGRGRSSIYWIFQGFCPSLSSDAEWHPAIHQFGTMTYDYCWSYQGNDKIRICPKGQRETVIEPSDSGGTSVSPCLEFDARDFRDAYQYRYRGPKPGEAS